MLLYSILGTCIILSTALDNKNIPQKVGDDDSYYPNTDFSDSFDWKLLKEFSTKYKNVLISPISIKLILALLYQASSGATEREFQSVLQFVDKKTIDDDYSRILQALQTSRRSEYLLNMGTSIFLDSKIQINPKFELKANQFYRTEVQKTNFTNSQKASATINTWVNQLTNGKVSQLVTPGDLHETIMLIANTVYFKGTWRHQFLKSQTYYDKFITSIEGLNNVKTITVPFMSTTDAFFIRESPELDSKILRLPYKGSDYSMFIILPNSIGGLPNVIKRLNLHILSSALHSMEKRTVEVVIPKFKFNFKAKMAEILHNFGLHQIFQNTASFTGLVISNSSVLRTLVVSDILQKSGIELDEEGSVVYSASGVNIGNKFGDSKETFHATHPFLFFVEGPSGSILFNGIIENPLESEHVETNVRSGQPPPVPVAAQIFSASNQFIPSYNVTEKPSFANFANLQVASVSNEALNLEPVLNQRTTDIDELSYRFSLFDMELLNAFSESSSNIMISPASVKVTLAMILEGAKGNSAQEIREALRISNINQKGVRDILETLLNNLNEKAHGTFLENSNGIFVSDRYKILEKYYQVIQTFYKGVVNRINFRNVGNAVGAINNWVSRATHDVIKEIITPQSIGPETTAVILNALYFKGKWKSSFDAQFTRTKCFHTVNGCISTPMMRGSMDYNYNYISRLRTHAIEIPYEDNFSMLILLPSEDTNIRSVIRDLPHFKLKEIVSSLKYSDITLEVPKFAFEYSVDLVNQLKALKIREIFSLQSNLSGIVEKSKVLINSMLHKTRIEVDEEGTVAAAVTGAVVIPLMGSTSVVIDRPFIFFIYHQKTANIIFEGIVSNPQEQSVDSAIYRKSRF